MGRFIRHQACQKCGSSDGAAVYDNGSTHCFVCSHNTGGSGKAEALSERDWRGTLQQINQLSPGNMLARGIDAKTAALFGVRIEYSTTDRSELAYYFPLYKDGAHVGYQKKLTRAPGHRQKTDTSRIGETAGNLPFGSHVAGNGGKMLIVVEGAEDCLAVHQMLASQGKGYRVVANLGAENWRRNLEYFEGFEKIAIAYDPDEGGRSQADEFAAALSHGKPVLLTLPSDPNQMLIDGQAKQFLDCLWNARAYTPTGIIYGEEVWRRMESYVQPDFIPYPAEFDMMARKTLGMREAEISTWIAGSSVGKTSYIRRLKQHALLTSDWKIGEVELEEAPEKTWRGLMQFHMGKRWYDMTAAERKQAYDETYGTNRIFTMENGRRSKEAKGGLLGKFKHLHYELGCRLFFLDHVTLGVREFGDKGGSLGDQDTMMEELLDFAETTKSHVCLISHLRKPPGGTKSWSQGAVPTEEDMKGSGSLYQISFDIFGVSRNKQHEDDY